MAVGIYNNNVPSGDRKHIIMFGKLFCEQSEYIRENSYITQQEMDKYFFENGQFNCFYSILQMIKNFI